MGFEKTKGEVEIPEKAENGSLRDSESASKDLYSKNDKSNLTLDFGQSGVETLSFFDDDDE